MDCGTCIKTELFPLLKGFVPNHYSFLMLTLLLPCLLCRLSTQEDINLTTTTLRFAATNEVSTINNSSLSEARIINCARSPKATIRFRITFDAEATTPKLIKDYHIRLESYLHDRPRKWAGLIQFANDGVRQDDGGITYLVGVQHVHSWQEMSKIVADKGELEQEALRLSQELDIHYSGPPNRMKVELTQNKADVC